MCGRVQLQMTWAELVGLYRMEPWQILEELELPSLNAAPTQALPVFTLAEDRRPRIGAMRWGWPALWQARRGRDPWRSPPLINARAEELDQRGSWAPALDRRRCIVPISAFYEWLLAGEERYPMEFSSSRGALLNLAGLWSSFEREGQQLSCVSLVTTAASPDMLGVHDRMPVILPRGKGWQWLDPALPFSRVRELLQPLPEGSLRSREVGRALNSWRATGPEVLLADWSRAALANP